MFKRLRFYDLLKIKVMNILALQVKYAVAVENKPMFLLWFNMWQPNRRRFRLH